MADTQGQQHNNTTTTSNNTTTYNTASHSADNDNTTDYLNGNNSRQTETLEEVDLSEYSDESPGKGFAPIATGQQRPTKDGFGSQRGALGLRRQSTNMIHDDDRRELQRIVTELSRRQTAGGAPAGTASVTSADGRLQKLERVDTETARNDPQYDPLSKQFNLEMWLKGFMQRLGEEGITMKHMSVTYKNLNVYGSGSALQLQHTVGDMLALPVRLGEFFSFGKKSSKHILRNFDGLVKSGELLIVLGRPGSGCSTLLKSLTGELHGLTLGDDSVIHYNGIPQQRMTKEFKGELIYNQEVDKHFPHLTVGQTLEFAAAMRTPSHRIHGITRAEHCKYLAKVVMAIYGLSHTYNTKVGNDFVRGVSGGERKRVSIAEMVLAGSPFNAWDNSTRGLDSATALKFVQALRLASDIGGSAHAVAIYQASQAIYDQFDKATVLYEGRQIYFGPAHHAKAFFEKQGWFCPQRQTTGDFLTSITNPLERNAREGMEDKVPRTPDEFETYWRESPEYKALKQEVDDFEHDNPIDTDKHGENYKQLQEQKQYMQSKHVRPKSAYMISVAMQVKLNTKRAYQRIWGDISATATAVFMNITLALIIGSVFYGTPDATIGFFSKGSVLFMAILLSALTAISEINNQYAQRPIVEKHVSYAFYHPSTEAMAGIVADVPIKFATATCFNLIIYFLSGLRREPAQFFLFFLITFISTFVMGAIFRFLAAITKTVSQAMAAAGIMVLALVIYTGFVIAVPNMHPWFSWIRWINPIFYAFEILIANEFHGREFTCSAILPPYTPLQGDSWICSVVGSVAGQQRVSGDAFIAQNYEYYYSHVWRNFGILLAFLFGFMFIYFIAVELNSATSNEAEVLVFRRGHVPQYLQEQASNNKDEEKAAEGAVDGKAAEEAEETNVDAIEPQTDIFTWRDVVYDIHIKSEERRLLSNVSGYVKPGTLTALMGVSGAGKTTLLDVLAQRTTMGVITGDMLVNGKPLDASFQRKTGYVQQQDLHLETATVRESLRFSAMLRQPKSVSVKEKYDFVEEVIDMLNMRNFAEAIVGVPGTGLNVEQRKLLTIGVELAAKPKLLLFLDEPTSGLDSQSSWAIVSFLRKLADAGQAILCTVHQPSAILFQEFDRLLFLAKGGKTVYFGNIGKNSRTLLDYFEANGGPKCPDDANPAEYMLDIVNKGENDRGEDWHDVWKASPQRNEVTQEIERLHKARENTKSAADDGAESHKEFAMPLGKQIVVVTHRVFQQYWRMPSYIGAKVLQGVAAGLFIGFTFYGADSSNAGLQDVLFSVFMLTTIFSTLVQQIQPLFITQRALYEVRERPSKAYSWIAFIFANIVVELPYQVITAILTWASYYYAVIGIQSSERQGLVLLFVIQLFLFASTFAHMTIAALPDAQTASGIVTIGTLMSTLFCGVLQSPTALPGFWIFMYRVSPFTYWVGGISSTQLHERPIVCSESELSIFNPPSGQTCQQYLAPFLQQAPGTLQNPNDTTSCKYCSLSNGDQFLASSNIYWSERWRNYGILWAFIIFNASMAVFTYYIFRVKKWNKGGKGGKGKKATTKSETAKKGEQGAAKVAEAVKETGQEAGVQPRNAKNEHLGGQEHV